jgi:hypothetical protein
MIFLDARWPRAVVLAALASPAPRLRSIWLGVRLSNREGLRRRLGGLARVLGSGLAG